jgi:hypothetical protein
MIEKERYRVTVEECMGNFISNRELSICEELFHLIEGVQHALQAWCLLHELDEPESCLG